MEREQEKIELHRQLREERSGVEPRGPIILFDAECVLCSANAQFVLKYDKVGHFRLASMQGDVGAALYDRHGLDPRNPNSMLVVEGDRVRQDSDAVLSIYEGLGFPWRLLGFCALCQPSFAIQFTDG